MAGLAGAPMRMGFGARGMAMGNAMTAVTSGDVQSYYNPALFRLNQNQLPWQRTEFFLSIEHSTF